MTRFPLLSNPARKSIAGWPLAAALAVALGLAGAGRAAEPTVAAPTALASLTVTFQGLKTPSGTIMVALSDGAESYGGKAPPAAQAAIPVAGGAAVATFSGLRPGTYAIRAFHDLNGDGRLNVNPFGIPTEPYAFSNNARGMMGPAPWAAAAFRVEAGENRPTIDID